MSVTRTWRLVAACILAGPLHGLSQEVPVGKPAPSNVRGKQFPMIHPDRRVTFRVTAPDAQKVAVVGHAAEDLALDEERVDDVAAVVADDVADDSDLAGVGVDVEDADVGAR